MPSIRREITLDLEAYERSQEIGNLSLFVRRCLKNTDIGTEGLEMGQVDLNAHLSLTQALQRRTHAMRLLCLALIEQVEINHPDFLKQYETKAIEHGLPKEFALELAIQDLQAKAIQQKSILDFEA